MRLILFSCLFVVFLRQAFRSVVAFFCIRCICFANSFPFYIIQTMLKRFTCLNFFSISILIITYTTFNKLNTCRHECVLTPKLILLSYGCRLTFYFNIRVQILQVKVLVRCNLHLSYLCQFLKDKQSVLMRRKMLVTMFKISFHSSDILKCANYHTDDFTNLVIVP